MITGIQYKNWVRIGIQKNMKILPPMGFSRPIVVKNLIHAPFKPSRPWRIGMNVSRPVLTDRYLDIYNAMIPYKGI